eukprot:6045-Heterococcus_DN1.PRE.3
MELGSAWDAYSEWHAQFAQPAGATVTSTLLQTAPITPTTPDATVAVPAQALAEANHEAVVAPVAAVSEQQAAV